MLRLYLVPMEGSAIYAFSGDDIVRVDPEPAETPHLFFADALVYVGEEGPGPDEKDQKPNIFFSVYEGEENKSLVIDGSKLGDLREEIRKERGVQSYSKLKTVYWKVPQGRHAVIPTSGGASYPMKVFTGT